MKLPGAEKFPDELELRLKTALANRGRDYHPRTRHVHDDKSPRFINRLIFSESPYLLQHAHNPVNWFAFGDDAFSLAKALNRPILLSIGYATCHWCHVMEEESFEDEEIAAFLNQYYVCIKVDREERPDVDAIYMAATQAISGHGGWPMTVWLKPDQRPFYAATYFPARDGDRGMHTGFLTMLRHLAEAYHQDPDSIDHAALQIKEALKQQFAAPTGASIPKREVIPKAMDLFRSRFDWTHGGTRGAPKFPSTIPVRLLLREYFHSGQKDLLDMALLTLKKISQGGINDHIGGGFHRYSVDERWLVPHFEKMLYDNALLVMSYVEAYQVSHDESLKVTALETLRYIMREMTSSAGGFFSATDADSGSDAGHNDEGLFFSWTPQELSKHLKPHDAAVVAAYYGVSDSGNFEGRSVLHKSKEISEIAKIFSCTESQIAAIITNAKNALYQARAKRHHPLRDEKIITAWNGLMISAFAKAGFAFNEPDFINHARHAAAFILKTLKPDQWLRRFFRQSASEQLGFLDDYAFLIAGFLDLYEAEGEEEWLAQAIMLDRILEREFEDAEHGGFFMTSTQHKELIAREKPHSDGAEPSGNSVAILNLLRLHQFCDEQNYKYRAEKALEAFSKSLTQYSMSSSEMLIALDFYWSSPQQIAIVSDKSSRELFLTELRTRFLPHCVKAIVEEKACAQHLIPWLQHKTVSNHQSTAFVCSEGECKLPVTNAQDFREQLGRRF